MENQYRSCYSSSPPRSRLQAEEARRLQQALASVSETKDDEQYTCDGCDIYPIRGTRYTKARADHDLCRPCFDRLTVTPLEP